jgi:hypothetical protein
MIFATDHPAGEHRRKPCAPREEAGRSRYGARPTESVARRLVTSMPPITR